MMTQENKELLINDLCGRLPCGVKVHAKYTDIEETIEVDGIVKMIDADGVVGIEVINNFSSAWDSVQIDNIKPYLFPLSSMTEKQYKEWVHTLDSIDWLNKNYFDYRSLIEKGLAIDATELNIY